VASIKATERKDNLENMNEVLSLCNATINTATKPAPKILKPTVVKNDASLILPTSPNLKTNEPAILKPTVVKNDASLIIPTSPNLKTNEPAVLTPILSTTKSSQSARGSKSASTKTSEKKDNKQSNKLLKLLQTFFKTSR